MFFLSLGLVKVYTDINWIWFSFQTGYTSLHLAAQNCHCKSLELLLKGGANPVAKNNVCLFYKFNCSFIRSYLLVLRGCNKLSVKAMLFVFVMLHGTIRNDDVLIARHSTTTLMRLCFEWLQQCCRIATLCCAKNRCCESSRLTSS